MAVMAAVVAVGAAAYLVHGKVSADAAGAYAAQVAERIEAAVPAEKPAASWPTVPDMEMPVYRDGEGGEGDDGSAAEGDGGSAARTFVGVLRIPALDLQLAVGAIADEDALSDSPCRLVGSAYADDMVVLGRNIGGHFGRLTALSPGDDVSFTDVDGNAFEYRVASIDQLPADEADAAADLDGGASLSDGYPLTLVTTSTGGEYRILVHCSDR